MKRDPHVRELRFQSIHDSFLKGIIANLAAVVLTGILFSEYIFAEGISLVLGLLLLINIIRLPYVFMIRKSLLDRNSTLALFWGFGSLHFSTLCWAAVILILYPHIETSQYLIFLVIIQALATGGMINLSVSLPLSLIHVNILMLPMIYISSVDTAASNNMHQPLVLFLYYIFLVFWSFTLNRHINNTFHLKLKHISSLEKNVLNERRYETIFEEAPAGIFYYDLGLIIQNSNSSFTQILQVESGSMNGFDMHNLPDKRVFSTLNSVTGNEKGFYEGPYHTAHSKNDIWISLRTSPILGNSGELMGGVGIVEDLTERIRIQNRIEYQAYHDTLTDLPNRQLLKDRLEQALKSVQRHGHLGGLLFLDLDKFKLINDTMGHRMGDLLLIEVARRLKLLLREEDTVARLGGDEFIVLLPNLDISAEKAVQYTDLVCGKIHDALSNPISLDKQNIQTSTSIGVYVFTSDDDSAEHILKSADTAMYDAKDMGRNRSSYYHSGMEENLKKRMVLEVELKEALKNNELSIYYQPIVETDNEKIVAAESLLRWNHSTKGFISPEDIINAAESSNQILILGDWIVGQVLSQFREWLDRGITELEYLSINISMKQILQPGFAEGMISKIRESGVPPHMIVLEITESVLISDFDMTVSKIRTLRKEGVQFALDDFGTGYSSLSYLKRLPVDKLKIDRYFTQTLLTNHDDYVLIKTILSIAEYFNLSVITEGVEEQAQVEKLKEMGCPLYQGYFCSKPVPPQDFIKLLS
ncbi:MULTISPECIES: EAL domain-containing protein [unclassified Oceanispirochaeta]|uniref:sensor domain-containing protein n=1 Tax=unclassified Oceanispirochaeta TaxID=2635722 RepID=UPI000E08EF5D|nr:MULTISPECIES: EAL domain-containing protein [unclassified Oceanispirochaeta]MBF9014340.1 EAL domain-containing protein [Oceanispirochaeta sp. M2]NPD71226.1 EAL domain-containing protein [Oceanispirochaeta sp. M1]RDG33612.1 EAL domain-containing protein [Oceanispirochaeta sp. M1]